jgi:hypothetical protein
MPRGECVFRVNYRHAKMHPGARSIQESCQRRAPHKVLDENRELYPEETSRVDSSCADAPIVHFTVTTICIAQTTAFSSALASQKYPTPGQRSYNAPIMVNHDDRQLSTAMHPLTQ